MGNPKIQWHPGFVAAMNLEFMENRDDLEFESEHNLNKKPLEIDLLIIRKNSLAKITNEIGNFFRGHNIIEYKSPEDSLDIDVFYKCGAYAALYKSYGKSLDERKAEDITVTILRKSKPLSLFKYFETHGYGLSCTHAGIYHVQKRVLFPTQIVVTRELDKKLHLWLRALSDSLEESDICNLLDIREGLGKTSERELADSVLEVALAANRDVIVKWKGDVHMFESIMEIFEEQLQPIYEKIRKEATEKGMAEGIEKGMEKGMEKGIQVTIGALRDFGHGDAEIKMALIKNYGLSEAEARTYL